MQIKKQILFILFYFWILLSTFFVLYNSFKVISEIKEWGFLTDTQKREKIFGETYDFMMYVNSKTPKNSRIFIYSSDDRISLTSRYNLYPRKLFLTTKSTDIKNLDNFDYIALYDKDIIINNFKKIAKFKSATSANFGVLYKNDD